MCFPPFQAVPANNQRTSGSQLYEAFSEAVSPWYSEGAGWRNALTKAPQSPPLPLELHCFLHSKACQQACGMFRMQSFGKLLYKFMGASSFYTSDRWPRERWMVIWVVTCWYKTSYFAFREAITYMAKDEDCQERGEAFSFFSQPRVFFAVVGEIW